MDLKLLQRSPVGDARGYLERMYCSHDLAEVLNGRTIEQINHTLTHQAGTVRGMHFQYPPFAECKIVSCLHGAIFDVAVDLRRKSSTFLQWHGEILSAENHRTLVIPEGFAHGYQTLEDDCELLYFHTALYHALAESGLNPNDPRVAITWPLPVMGLSPRDASHALLNDNFAGIES
jgi:dTDP-4-dehydrorhamnose 3,5-epimerase